MTRLRAFGDAVQTLGDPFFYRVAVRPEQTAAWRLPTRPTSRTDSRTRCFAGDSVDVDAIEPARLRLIVRQCLEQQVDPDALDVLRTAEASEREALRVLARDIRRRAAADDDAG